MLRQGRNPDPSRSNQIPDPLGSPNPDFPPENRVSSIKDQELSIRHLPYRLSYRDCQNVGWALAHAVCFSATRVLDRLTPFAQNKPNSKTVKTNLTLYNKTNYEKNSPFAPRKNKPKQTQSKPNFKPCRPLHHCLIQPASKSLLSVPVSIGPANFALADAAKTTTIVPLIPAKAGIQNT